MEVTPILKENYIIEGEIITRTGLMIGGTKDTLKIGGVDTPIIRDPRSGDPYIPGSSLKGKMRSLVEYSTGKYDKDGNPHGFKEKCNDQSCKICVVFGSLNNENVHVGRLVVRDSFLLEEEDFEIEIKTENVINRIQGRAQAPRTFERVPANTRFGLELIYSSYGVNNDKELLSTIFEALSMLQDSYLGSSGSRGYGKIEFRIKRILKRTVEDYEKGNNGTILFDSGEGSLPSELLAKKPWNGNS